MRRPGSGTVPVYLEANTMSSTKTARLTLLLLALLLVAAACRRDQPEALPTAAPTAAVSEPAIP